MITDRQREIYLFVKRYLSENKTPPTRLEIAANFDVSLSTIQGHIKALQKKGYVEISSDIPRGLMLTRKRLKDKSLLLTITDRQREVYLFIRRYLSENKIPPTRLEIAINFDVNPNTIQDHLKALQKKGYVEILSNIPRGLMLTRKRLKDAT